MTDDTGSTGQPRSLVRLWFSFRTPVNRRDYLLSGVSLAVIKYTIDAAIIFAATGVIWTPWGYLNPWLSTRQAMIDAPHRWIVLALFPWTIPFLWIAASMSIRRAMDAGLSPWVGLLFFVPILNHLMMLTLCLLPSAASPRSGRSSAGIVVDSAASFMLSAAVGATVGLVLMAVSVYGLGVYSAALFLGVPFCVGLVTAFLYNLDHPRSEVATMGAVQVSVLLMGGALLLFALEGLVCILMAYPMATVLAGLGGMIGHMMARTGEVRGAHTAMVLLSLPLLMGFEAIHRDVPLREVVTSIEIAAPPAAVWPHVVGFSELPPPSELVFRLGIAYPMRARIEGSGVGAVRHCEFSTGAFVEPITRWEPPARLSFDVKSQPKPMHEWSPYNDINAPHLVDNMRSKRGEFRLIALANGHTRLEGSTWYEIDMFPQAYWTLWSDMLVHHIHHRVLAHIKTETETEK